MDNGKPVNKNKKSKKKLSLGRCCYNSISAAAELCHFEVHVSYCKHKFAAGDVCFAATTLPLQSQERDRAMLPEKTEKSQFYRAFL